MNPFFSIVIPCFNRGELLERALRSCVSQTFQNFECIVVDDGSTEDIGVVVEKFKDDRILLIRQNNSGGSAARNTGIRNAKGEWIALLDADDYFLENKLEVFFHRIQANPSDLLYSYAYIDRGHEKKWLKPDRAIQNGEDITEYLFCKYQRTSTSTFVVRAEVARKVLFDESLPLGQDIDFKIRLVGGGHSISMIEEVLSVYDDSGSIGRVSRGNKGEVLEIWLERNRHYFSQKGYRGYRATMLSKYIAKRRPFTTLKDLTFGLLFAGVGLKMTARRAVRAFFPQSYNKIVAYVMRKSGR
ncbi:glycosyltransferase family 2 protein [Pannonibacter phragmitetus]|uniref:glycosyltransferase family 2 protein n=1 Tax=Pannonibacter phragmitetus TaxID=121719 RepID=UPI0013C43699|nr:glycosyltransferase family 2 protein [Pannonibacter phragmitetus]